MENSKFLIIGRNIAIMILVFGIVIFRKDNVDAYAVILMLLYIINNQVRFFIFNKKKFIVIGSIILELILSYVCYKNYGGIGFFYFFITVLDGAFLLKGILSYIINGVTISIMVFVINNASISEIISSVSALIILIVSSTYIKEENNRKINAENLYDKLRISEEKLKKANKDLEAYANSIEELTLLRERNRISREIHDSVGHNLSTIMIQLGAVEKIAKQDGEVAAGIASNLREYAKNSLQEVRDAVRQLKPEEYEKYAGILAVEELIKNFTKLTGVDVRLGFTKEKWTLNTDQSFVIYRVVQEFLSNSLRHGQANRVNIFMTFNKDNLIITMKDNGDGTDKVIKGVGLTSIYERVNELGGRVQYNSKKNEGFFLKVVLNRKDMKVKNEIYEINR
ncbi:sensor histidine kinase [Oceanirhabdus sp. W0125-5]|uniref:sensor histidine kinase n=1 Tax=Oceanirhabdus sp. W0125-5 TaxID=2999116 RepID=UPI0022F2BC1D|nr:sensor histidine kinase [Oceanirhabdus sp. W0125-5]WBW99815.1 sensor histidine kinase [Oceanirhabdus sp. W0125-5]